MDGWLDSHQFHECVPGCQGTNQSRRLLRRWQGLHRLHIVGERNTGHRRPVLQAYAHVQCLQRAQLHLLGMVHRPLCRETRGEPEFYDTIYQPFFFSALGYDRNDYTKIRIAETVTPWKDQRSRGSVEIYVRNDIYKNVLHSPDTGIAWPDGAKRR